MVYDEHSSENLKTFIKQGARQGCYKHIPVSRFELAVFVKEQNRPGAITHSLAII